MPGMIKFSGRHFSFVYGHYLGRTGTGGGCRRLGGTRKKSARTMEKRGEASGIEIRL